jgi:hypothetical protein
MTPHPGSSNWAVNIMALIPSALAISSSVDALAKNDRCCPENTKEKFGTVMFVAMEDQDSLNEKFKSSGHHVKKGDEIGLFEFGGSSIIVLFENGRIRWDQDLIDWSMKRIMVDVEVGMKVYNMDGGCQCSSRELGTRRPIGSLC